MRSKKPLRFFLFGGLLVVSLSQILLLEGSRFLEEAAFSQLAEQVEEETPEGEDSNASAGPGECLPQYEALHQENPDLAGWVQIEGTSLDYPVMETPEDPEFYLHRAFDQSESESGTPFLGAGCSLQPRSDQLILYGHNMKNQTMFAPLLKYQEKDFWKEHPVITFDTLFQKGEYEIFSVFDVDVTLGNGHFPFYRFVDFASDQEAQAFIETCQECSFYDTGVQVDEEDSFLTLVTCSYHTENGRRVVVAKELDRQEGEPN